MTINGTDDRTNYRLAVVGGGNMGAALVGGLIAGGWSVDDLAVVEVADARRDTLTTMFPEVTVSATVPPCEAALIAVKPYDAADAATAAAAAGARRVLSIAAGVSIETLQQACGDGVVVVRSIPNTPALIRGCGAMCAGPFATDEDLDWAEGILGTVGTVARARNVARRRHRPGRQRARVPLPRRRGADRRRSAGRLHALLPTLWCGNCSSGRRRCSPSTATRVAASNGHVARRHHRRRTARWRSTDRSALLGRVRATTRSQELGNPLTCRGRPIGGSVTSATCRRCRYALPPPAHPAGHSTPRLTDP